MPVAYENIYGAAQAIMALVATAASETITQAASNFDELFEVPTGECRYQLQVEGNADDRTSDANLVYPRVTLTVRIHFRVATRTDEETFLHVTLWHLKEQFFSAAIWESGTYALAADDEPSLEVTGREGNVISAEATLVVLWTGG